MEDSVRVGVEARHAAVSPGGPLHVRITLTCVAAASDATWVDWVALQLCGMGLASEG